MSSVMRRSACGFHRRLAHWAAPLICLYAAVAAACSSTGGLASSEVYSPPPAGPAQGAVLPVARPPAGPPPPSLIRLPQAPSNPTDFQRAQYNRTVASDNATNASRIAAWRAETGKSLEPWQQQVVEELGKK